MTEPIHDPEYWKRRLATIPPGERHHAIFRCNLDRWRRIEAKHKEILQRHIELNHSVLDAGCGWGRLLELMPCLWYGRYLGIDLSPDFIDLAIKEKCDQVNFGFVASPLEVYLPKLGNKSFDWAIMVSFKPMVIRNRGQDAWQMLEIELRRVARKLLYLEYDEDDEGAIQ